MPARAAVAQSPGRAGRRDRATSIPSRCGSGWRSAIASSSRVKDDAEWKIISERIEKVTEARREVGFRGGLRRDGGGRGAGWSGRCHRRRHRRGGGGGGGGRRRIRRAKPARRRRRSQKAIEANAPADEIKSKLQQVPRLEEGEGEPSWPRRRTSSARCCRVKQEAAAVLAGLLEVTLRRGTGSLQSPVSSAH